MNRILEVRKILYIKIRCKETRIILTVTQLKTIRKIPDLKSMTYSNRTAKVNITKEIKKNTEIYN